jgi:hypothetical protein
MSRLNPLAIGHGPHVCAGLISNSAQQKPHCLILRNVSTCEEMTFRITLYPEVHGCAVYHPQQVLARCVGQIESLPKFLFLMWLQRSCLYINLPRANCILLREFNARR